MNLLRHIPRHDMPAYALYTLIALGIMLPLLRPGFILTLDMVFTPVLRLPQDITSSYPFHALLHTLNLLIPADILQKCLLLAIFLLASIGLHRLVRTLRVQPDTWGLCAGSIFYAVNPFTYSRLMAGQYAVLLGYALLPWFVRQLILCARQPTTRHAVSLGVIATIIGIISIHTLGAVALLTGSAILTALWQRRNGRAYIRHALIAVGLFTLLSSYWLIPLVLAQGKTAHIVQHFTPADTAAFATTGGSVVGKLGNLLRLQGFWAEGRALYTLPQDHVVLWGLTALLIIGLAATGLLWLWRQSPGTILVLGVSAIMAIVLALGLASGLLTAIGLREPHKLVGLVALAYSVGLAYGIHVVLQKCASYGTPLHTGMAVAGLVLPLLLTRVLFWGASGQLTARPYPTDWHIVNTRLNRDTNDFSVLFLPWHQYMPFTFSDHRIMGNPASAYFDKPVITSKDPEFAGSTSGQQDGRQEVITRALHTARDSENFGRQLARQDVKYILLAKEADDEAYDFLRNNPSLSLVRDYPHITLYKNNLWRQP